MGKPDTIGEAYNFRLNVNHVAPAATFDVLAEPTDDGQYLVDIVAQPKEGDEVTHDVEVSAEILWSTLAARRANNKRDVKFPKPRDGEEADPVITAVVSPQVLSELGGVATSVQRFVPQQRKAA